MLVHAVSLDLGAEVHVGAALACLDERAEPWVVASHDEPNGVQLGPVGEIALATGGSARAVGRLAGGLVGKEELGAALEHAISSRKPLKNQRRRRSLPAGILILDALHSAIDMPLTIAASGLREGVLLHLAEAGSPHGPGTPAFDRRAA